LRSCTLDGLPIFGRFNDFSNLIIAAGHAMLGMSLGPIAGKLVAQLVGMSKRMWISARLGLGDSKSQALLGLLPN
jgi:glycine/D-amino acid oxidase-like deaminating enzyme